MAYIKTGQLEIIEQALLSGDKSDIKHALDVVIDLQEKRKENNQKMAEYIKEKRKENKNYGRPKQKWVMRQTTLF